MVIESRTIVGAAGAFALVGAALWISAQLFDPPARSMAGSVEIVELPRQDWTVEVKDLNEVEPPGPATRTASNH